MAYSSWRQAVRELLVRTGPASEQQRHLAAAAGITLPRRLPRLVAAARLKSALKESLDLPASWPSSDDQLSYIKELGGTPSAPADHREGNAWIEHLWLKKRLHVLKKLHVEAGDILDFMGNSELVSSIGGDGRLHFKGGAGAGAWPDEVQVRFKRDAKGSRSQAALREAENRAALRMRQALWSESKRQELAHCLVTARTSETELQRLRSVIDSARDEAPIHAFLEEHPHILAGLLGGDERFAVSKLKLGAKYVTDFMLASVDSLGIGWLLVELETPRSSITLASGNDLEAHARKGVSQVREWREWLVANIAMARASTRDEGLGLIDIRPQSRGLVLVGRRDRLHENSGNVRQSFREQQNIEIHTYDWLLETLESNLRFVGPPASNPRYFNLSVNPSTS